MLMCVLVVSNAVTEIATVSKVDVFALLDGLEPTVKLYHFLYLDHLRLIFDLF